MIRVVTSSGALLAGPEDKRVRDILSCWPAMMTEDSHLSCWASACYYALLEFCGHADETWTISTRPTLFCHTCNIRVERVTT